MLDPLIAEERAAFEAEAAIRQEIVDQGGPDIGASSFDEAMEQMYRTEYGDVIGQYYDEMN